MHEKEDNWCKTVVLKRNRKIIALINVHRLVDLETSRVNSCKDQCERAIGNVKRVRQIRKMQLR